MAQSTVEYGTVATVCCMYVDSSTPPVATSTVQVQVHIVGGIVVV